MVIYLSSLISDVSSQTFSERPRSSSVAISINSIFFSRPSPISISTLNCTATLFSSCTRKITGELHFLE